MNNLFTLIIFLLLFTDSICLLGADDKKERVIVMSDIGGTEPDDQESFVRFLLYSNEIDIVGLIGANSQFGINRGDVGVFNKIIDEYDKIRPNLLTHAKGYPNASYLKSVVFEGQRTYAHMDGVGDGFTTPGSNHILKVLKNNDSRPLWVLAWGGTNTLAQALYDLQQEELPESEVSALIAKLRIYDIAGQDKSGAWIAHTFPEIFYVRSINQFKAFSYREDWQNLPCQDGDLSVVSAPWFQENVQNNHGDYGKMYPDAKYMWEGDTPSFLYLVKNGLNNSEYPHYGSWGGRFTKEKISPVGRYMREDLDIYMPAYMYNTASDEFIFNDSVYNNVYTPLWRWRYEYQNDFAARMDWAISSNYSGANHQPLAVINKDQTKDIIYIHANAGEMVNLSASGSNDPDNDELIYKWWNYFEAGSYSSSIAIINNNSKNISLKVPDDAKKNDTIHIILSLSDNGNPVLTSYRRIVIVVGKNI